MRTEPPLVGYQNDMGERPFVPAAYRRRVFDTLHRQHHPGVRASKRLVQEQHYWPTLGPGTERWTKTYIECQTSKIARHTRPAIGRFAPVQERFAHIHLDILSLVPSDGMRYALIMTDRFICWTEVIPMATMDAPSVTFAFVSGRVQRFGAPYKVTADFGTQFKSDLFISVLNMLGTQHHFTPTYHPAGNGKIERFHRNLPSTLRALGGEWTYRLPLDWGKIVYTM